jgi:LPS O-antigen subunit length determinant protein (WzzB/FepE family)
VLLALSTGNKVGLAGTALLFICFALFSSFVAPRRWPDFPGRGKTAFILASVALFVIMLAAVELFGVEKKEQTKGEAAALLATR